jgi:hypothetical protein
MVGGVCFEGELQELVGFAAMAFPPVDEGDGGEDGRRVFGAAVRVSV